MRFSASAAFAIVFLVFVDGLPFLRAQTLPSAWRSGIATNYGSAYDGMDPNNPSFGTSIGGCGYGLLDKTKFPYWSVGALSTKNVYYLAGPQNGCGECFEIQCLQNGPNYAGRCNTDPNARSVTIMSTDACPECEPDHIDIQALTFNKMAPMIVGRVDIQYRRVECTPPSGVTVSVDSNEGAGGWLRLTVQKVAGVASISLVQIQGQGITWQSMDNKWGASWEIAAAPPPPLDLRIVQTDGSEVTAFGFIDSNGEKGTLPVGVNFATSNTSGVTAITTLPGLAATDLSSTSISSSTSTSSSSSQVTAFEGPDSSSPPSTASSPPPQAYPPPALPPPSYPTPSPTPSGSACSDTLPPGSQYQCYQQKQYGACSASWMTVTSSTYPKGYCASTCGRC